jgi:transposase
MRGADITQEELFSYRTLEARIPHKHPLRKLRKVVDLLLATTLDDEFDALYARRGRDSIPPERLLRASLLQVLFSIRSERQLVEHIDFNLLYRWFIGLTMDDEVWDHSTFSANRDRLLNERISRLFFERVLALAEWKNLISDEHFSVDGTLIQAWASHKSFVKKDGSTPPPEDGGRNPTVHFNAQRA